MTLGFLLAIILTAPSTAWAQPPSKLPSVVVQSLAGEQVDAASFSNNGKPLIVNFWATWCAPCKKELAAISEVYKMWQERTGVKLIAISVDDARSMARVAPYVSGQSWDFEVYLDPQGNLMQELDVRSVPHTLLLNGSGEVVWQHGNYLPGDENELFRKILELARRQ